MSSSPKVCIHGNYDRLIAWKNNVRFVKLLFSHYTMQVIRLLCIEYRQMENISDLYQKMYIPENYIFLEGALLRFKLSCICIFFRNYRFISRNAINSFHNLVTMNEISKVFSVYFCIYFELFYILRIYFLGFTIIQYI